MFLETLAPDTKKLLDLLKHRRWIADFYLAGGTALALQYGHRQSVDLDWFTAKPISVPQLIKKVSRTSRFEILNEAENTLEGILQGVKVSFMTYPYPLLKKASRYEKNISLANPLDIAVMKIGAIAGRNTKKDFIDLFVFLHRENMPLTTLLAHAKKKFTGAAYDPYHIYKSLMYFADAEEEPMPRMLHPAEWKEVKRFFTREVKNITHKNT